MSNELTVRQAVPAELDRILSIYADARAYMAQNGNPTQWGQGYPPEELVRTDVQGGHAYVCADGDDILGVFYFAKGPDPTYERIEGAWLNDRPYHVIHRIAVAKHAHGRGVAAACFAYAFAHGGNVRIDTHQNNLPMQRALQKNGFVPCGTIFLENGEPRMAFHRA